MRDRGGVGVVSSIFMRVRKGGSFYWCGSFYSEMTSFSFSLISASSSEVVLLLLTVTFTLLSGLNISISLCLPKSSSAFSLLLGLSPFVSSTRRSTM